MKDTLTNRINRLKGDRVIWIIFLVFAMISLAVVYSASSALAYRSSTTPFSIMLRQAGYYAFGFLIVLACYRIPLKWYRFLSYAAMGFAMILLIVPICLGELRSFSFLGVQIHPSEIAKVATVLYLARIIEASPIDTFKEYALKILIPVGAVCALAMLGSMSAALIIGTLTLVILICSGIRSSHRSSASDHEPRCSCRCKDQHAIKDRGCIISGLRSILSGLTAGASARAGTISARRILGSSRILGIIRVLSVARFLVISRVLSVIRFLIISWLLSVTRINSGIFRQFICRNCS